MANNNTPVSERDKLHLGTMQFLCWLDGKSIYGRAFLAFIAGALLSRCFAPVNMFPLVFLAIPVCLLLVSHARGGRDAFAAGWWFGLGLFSVGLNWVGHSFTQQDQVPAILAPFAVFFLAAILALYQGIVFWVSWRLGVRGWRLVLVFAAIWTLMEVARSIWFSGFPWHLIGSMWADWLSVAQILYLIGIYGLSFLTLLVAGSFFLFFDRGGFSMRGLYVPCAALVVLAIVAGTGYYRLHTHATRFDLDVSMRLVQANVPQREKWISYLIDDHFDSHMQLSRSSDKNGKAEGIKLLIWPETAVQRESFDREGSLLRWRMSKLLDFGSYALTGAPRYTEENDEIKYYNSLIAINSKAELYARYDKNHLVPFGEYMPFADFLRAIGLSQLAGDVAFASGTELKTISLPGVPSFSPLICYESLFSGHVIRLDDRPEWLLNISNDGWFGMTEGPYQHLAQARLRAIEEGLPLVRSTSTGISAVIDSYGRTVSSLGLGKMGTVESPLPLSIEPPLVSSMLRNLLMAFLTAVIVLYYLIQVVRAWRTAQTQK
ncbi:apolipoprotein N-acyltransferase [Kordiimonas pumila]|uniref:Apolipoprotein N-acyltransferase n=1 Tax=Kordiimonas pumila TaxID=2161677 RepID=A0ABV7CZY7_9PROT|nr:apolipoprotein N-acyltransferase [Kordiimonas pumila]